MYSARQMVRTKERSFCLFKPCVNFLYGSILFSNDVISWSNSAFPWISNFKRPNLMLPFWQKCVSQLLPSIWSVLLEYLYQFQLLWIMELFWDVFCCCCCCCCFFRCFCCCCFFSPWFSFLVKILSLAVKMQRLRQPLLNWL